MSFGLPLPSSEPTEDEIARRPWKYIGYSGFTSFISSDKDFFALRRFNKLHTRVLLSLQADLQLLERRLDDLDAECASRQTKLGSNGLVKIDLSMVKEVEADKSLRDVNNGTVQDDLPKRKTLITDIRTKLAEYDDILVKYSSVQSLCPAPQRNIRNIEQWLANNNLAIVEDEANFINNTTELVSFAQPKAKLRQWFEDHVIYPTRHRLGLFRSHTNSQSIYTFRHDAVDSFGAITVFAAATIMLIVPLWILQTLETLHKKLAVITSFLFAFLLFLSCATLGRPFERLAATAGYAAVLAVFLQLD